MLCTSFANGSRAYLVLPLALLFVCSRSAAGSDYELIVESAQIKKTKANGKEWDAANGLPDPYVIVFAQSSGAKKRKQIGKTAVHKDTYSPHWNEKMPAVKVGDVVTVEVWDKDVAQDDLIGRYTFTVTDDHIKQRTIPLSFDQVDKLQLILRSGDDTVVKRPNPPELSRDPKAEPDKQPRLVAQLGHSSFVNSVAFSPDGKQVLTGSDDKTARLWELQSGKELRTLEHADTVTSVAFSPDGKQVLIGSGKTAQLWDVQSGKELRTFSETADRVWSVAFSPDGKQVLIRSGETARLWDAQSGKELRTFSEPADRVWSVAFSPDGTRVLTGSADKKARLWDAATGKKLRQFTGHQDGVNAVAFSRDGKKVLTASFSRTFVGSLSGDSTVTLWDAVKGKKLRKFTHTSKVNSVAFSPDGKQVLTGIGIVATNSHDVTARLWDTATGKELHQFTGHRAAVSSVAFSPDGTQVLTGSWDNTAHLWNSATGKEIRQFTGHASKGPFMTISQEGKHVLTGSWDGMHRRWDTASGKGLPSFTGPTSNVSSVTLSPDGTQLLTGSNTTRVDGVWIDHAAHLWDAATGKELRQFTGHLNPIYSVAFSPDGKQVLTGGDDNTSRLWNAATGKELRQFTGHLNTVYSVAFSPDGKQVLTGSSDHTARLWDAATGKECCRFSGHTSDVYSVAFSPDGKQVLTGSKDGTTRLWEARTGRKLCRLISFRDGSWAVVDPNGRFDAANGGDVEGLHWVIGNEPIALKQLKQRYYDPGLLAKYIGFNKEPLRQVEAFTNPKLFPEVQVAGGTPEKPQLAVTLTNRGGGIGRVVVLLNGKEITADARGPKADVNADKLQLEVNLANDPRLVSGQENLIEVHAYNAEGYLRSRGLRRIYTPPGKTNSSPPELWLVVAGVSDYRGDTLDLRYAAKDADDFAYAARIAGERLFGADKVHLRLLTSTQKGAEHQPSRANLAAALKAAQKAKPGDVLVVYLAGHGINYGGQDGDFYFLCCDAADANLADSEVRKQVALSSNELTELLKVNPAKKQVLLLDTCASGKLIDKLTEKRDVPSSQIRALELVKDRTGMYILAGCASNAVSYEATRFAQGVLTYSLLLGMRGAALKEDRVEVGRLFEFAADKVPELARDIGGIQKPVIASPKGGQPFPIGRLTAEDQARIPLQAVRPLVLRCSLQDEVKVRDQLGLSKRVNERLREASASGRSAKLVFVEAEEFPDAYVLVGRYRLAGDTVKVTLSLFRGDQEVAQFSIEGGKTDLDALAGKIVRVAEQKMERRPGNSRK